MFVIAQLANISINFIAGSWKTTLGKNAIFHRFWFPQVVQKHTLGEVENYIMIWWKVDDQLSWEYSYRKVLTSDNPSSSHNQKCLGCFFCATVCGHLSLHRPELFFGCKKHFFDECIIFTRFLVCDNLTREFKIAQILLHPLGHSFTCASLFNLCRGP